MKITIFKSIEDIPKHEWEMSRMDFAISDGVYEFAKYNEENSSFDMNYLKIEEEERTYFLIMYFVTFDEGRESNWYNNFLKDYFGEIIVDKLNKQDYRGICMIMFPRNIASYDEIEWELKKYLDNSIECNKRLRVFSLFQKPKIIQGYIYEQKPYMFFDLSEVKSFDDYLGKCNSKIRHIIRNDRSKLDKNNITIKRISSREYISIILELNNKSIYPLPNTLIEAIPHWEEMDVCRTVGFFRGNILVQFLSIMIAGEEAYTIAGNISNELKEWSGTVNNYNVFIEQCILYGIKNAYIGFECSEEKIHRGAIPLKKYLYFQ